MLCWVVVSLVESHGTESVCSYILSLSMHVLLLDGVASSELG